MAMASMSYTEGGSKRLQLPSLAPPHPPSSQNRKKGSADLACSARARPAVVLIPLLRIVPVLMRPPSAQSAVSFNIAS